MNFSESTKVVRHGDNRRRKNRQQNDAQFGKVLEKLVHNFLTAAGKTRTRIIE
jgi:hypothetical protein